MAIPTPRMLRCGHSGSMFQKVKAGGSHMTCCARAALTGPTKGLLIGTNSSRSCVSRVTRFQDFAETTALDRRGLQWQDFGALKQDANARQPLNQSSPHPEGLAPRLTSDVWQPSLVLSPFSTGWGTKPAQGDSCAPPPLGGP